MVQCMYLSRLCAAWEHETASTYPTLHSPVPLIVVLLVLRL